MASKQLSCKGCNSTLRAKNEVPAHDARSSDEDAGIAQARGRRTDAQTDAVEALLFACARWLDDLQLGPGTWRPYSVPLNALQSKFRLTGPASTLPLALAVSYHHPASQSPELSRPLLCCDFFLIVHFNVAYSLTAKFCPLLLLTLHMLHPTFSKWGKSFVVLQWKCKSLLCNLILCVCGLRLTFCRPRHKCRYHASDELVAKSQTGVCCEGDSMPLLRVSIPR